MCDLFIFKTSFKQPRETSHSAKINPPKIMKKIIATLVILAISVASVHAASGHVQPQRSHNNRPSSGNHNYHNSHRSNHYHYRHRPSRPPAIYYEPAYVRSYRYAWPAYYTPFYAPYGYGYGYGFPGVSVSYSTYSNPDAPGYAAGGAVLGGVLGAIIGNNSGGRHNNTWAGAAIGSTLGYFAGSAADNAAVRQQRAAAEARQEAINRQLIHTPTPAPQPVEAAPRQTHVPRPSAAPRAQSSMSQANALFGRQ